MATHTWQGSTACPTCGTKGGVKRRCTNCNSIGCSKNSCAINKKGANYCAFCNKQTKEREKKIMYKRKKDLIA